MHFLYVLIWKIGQLIKLTDDERLAKVHVFISLVQHYIFTNMCTFYYCHKEGGGGGGRGGQPTGESNFACKINEFYV